MDTLIAILIVLTNTAQFDSAHATGVWLEEFAAPHQIFMDAGAEITVASPLGGVVPIDPRSWNEESEKMFGKEAELLKDTKPLADVDVSQYDALFFPGGHGTMFDLPGNELVQSAILGMYEEGKVIAAVCHGPAAFADLTFSDGTPFLKDKKIACFTDDEERAVQLDGLMPFMLESKLSEQGATVETAENFQSKVVVDGQLVTGQNPASSVGVAEAVLKAVGQK